MRIVREHDQKAGIAKAGFNPVGGVATFVGMAVAAFLVSLCLMPASARADSISEIENIIPKVDADTTSYVDTQTDVPWYRSFTLRSSQTEETGYLPKPDVEFRASSQWGITIGLNEQDPLLDSKDRMSAGAFYNISPRIRLGGELSFTAPGELRISTPKDHAMPLSPGDNAPVVRIESTIRF